MTAFRVVIPVRYASSRLPGKPLLEFAGKTILEHVYINACASSAESVLIATDDHRIVDAATKFGGDVCMTSAQHHSGTDRIAEAVQSQGWKDDVIVNLQGDEPQMPANNINQVAKLLIDHPQANIATLCQRLTDINEYQDPNIVKVTKDKIGNALYFSRSSIPNITNANQSALEEIGVFRHIGIYAYRINYLQEFINKPQSTLEKVERLEQLRALEAGDRIVIDECVEAPGIGVDTQEDYSSLCESSPK